VTTVTTAGVVPVAAEVLPPPVLDAFGLEAYSSERETGGLINRTFLARDPAGRFRAVVQRLHPIFSAEVNVDLEAVTDHVARAGMVTPRLLRTRDGARWFEHDGGVWRALTYIEGVTLHQMPDVAHARAAGELVGRFHLAVRDLQHTFAFQRLNVHDTAGHLKKLAQAARAAGPAPVVPAPVSGSAALTAEAGDLARRILDAGARLPPLGDLPRRVMHGDLKVSNVRFAAPPGVTAVCLIDLDTLGPQNIAYELGDGLRSWCNPEGEDTGETRFDLAVFAAALEGYAVGAAGLLTPAEMDAILPGLETVCLELAARFCVDVFEDRYFGWNPERFSSRRQHNLVRAQGQLALALAVGASRPAARAAVQSAFA
jgi:Ser/Thr protein kinase RdoA (MazF antagonist)